MPKRIIPLALASLLSAVWLAGCADKDVIMGSTGGVLDDPCDLPGAANLFQDPYWPAGSAFRPDGSPAFSACGVGATDPTGVPVENSDPAEGSAVPDPSDDIDYHGSGELALDADRIAAIVAAYNNGRPNADGDTVVFPSVSTLMAAGETYAVLLLSTQGALDLEGTGGTPRTRTVGIAFGNGAGGFTPVAPNTGDPFATALVWMKATRNPYSDTWSMEQADWRAGSGTAYPTSLRLILHDQAAMAIIRHDELKDLEATQYRWDTFSYTTDPATEWSHDHTDWVAFR